MRWRRVALLALVFFALGDGTALAQGGPFAPLNRPGPALSVPAAKLKSALSCTPGIAGDQRDPILLVPGTNLDPSSNYSWNYERAFAALHWSYCTVTLPYHTMGDVQTAGEYVVYALRTMAATARRQVDILGYSQGGMLPRWALRFWPDTRRLVHTYVALDPSNHGTLDANAACQKQCAPADWQQAADAHFIAALNSYTETFAGIYYTVIFSRTDEIVFPNLDPASSSSLHTGAGHIANIAVQQICPADTSEHLAMGSYDAVGYALAVDALSHESLADPGRIAPTVCAEPFQPGVNPSTFPTDWLGYLNAIGQAEQEAPQVSAEPPLKCYVFASCRIGATRPSHKTKPGAAKRPARRRRGARSPSSRSRSRPSFTG